MLRGLNRFALLAAAGQLAVNLGVLPFNKEEIISAISKCFDAWLTERGGHQSSEVQRRIAQVKLFFEKHGESRFDDLVMYSTSSNRITHPAHNRAGFKEHGDIEGNGGFIFYVFPEFFKREMCKGFNPKLIIGEMIKRGYMEPGKDGPSTVKHIEAYNKAIRVYKISDRILRDE